VLKSVGITNASQIAGINGGLAAWNLILALLAGFNVERVGRRPIFFISFIGLFFSSVFVMGVAVIPFLFIYCEWQTKRCFNQTCLPWTAADKLDGFYDIAMTPLPYHYSTGKTHSSAVMPSVFYPSSSHL
jgi:hypothetical protein